MQQLCQVSRDRLLLHVLAIIFFLVGCSQSTTSTATSWLSHPVCATPCWNTLTPGQTTLEGLKQWISQESSVADVYIAATPGGVAHDFQWKYTNSNVIVNGDYQITNGQAIITRLSVNIGNMPLQDIIAKYGQPSHVIAIAGYSPEHEIHYSTLFVFIQHGFAVAMNPKNASEVLGSDSYVTGVDFFAPSIMGFAQAFRLQPGLTQTLTVWRGFGPFRMYCQAPDGSDACNH